MPPDHTDTLQQMNMLFGSYKAEWLNESIYDHFTEPTYFPDLTTARPCFLLGGRGTGKTTTLLGLSYHGQFAFHKHDPASIPSWSYYGIFYRVNINRVAAFRGEELPEEKWIKLFSHYLNLVVCHEIAKFVKWFSHNVPSFVGLSKSALQLLSKSLLINEADTIDDLIQRIREASVVLEGTINSVADEPSQPLSLQGAPIDLFFEQLKAIDCFVGKQFFVLIDEYENFEDYQQRVVNTLIKHSSPLYSFKVGVRELGFRCRTTLNLSEQLVHPSDYVRVNIGEMLTSDRFAQFAENVCQARLRMMPEAVLRVTELFPGMSPDQELEYLDVKHNDLATKASDRLAAAIGQRAKKLLNGVSLAEKYFIVRRAESSREPIEKVFDDFLANKDKWRADLNNHRNALLFTFGKSGAKNPKLYCGWKAYTSMAHSNIRYLLELVDQAIKRHLADGKSLSNPISFEAQTEAAYMVGRKNLTELEGLSVDGAKLTKLLLGLGRVFQLLASSHYHDNPEVTQFSISPSASTDSAEIECVESLLKSAVNHLALVRFRGTKLNDESETREYDYMIHPIFSPFFIISYRKKRKLPMLASQVLGLINRPKSVIAEILKTNPADLVMQVPVQLELFKVYYESGD